MTGLRVVLNDGASHAVDSSDIAFQAAARGAFREVYSEAKPQILEPIMRVAVEGPGEFQGAFVKTVMQRRGIIVGTTEARGLRARRGRRAAGRDVRLLHRPALGDPGQGRVHDGVRRKYAPVPAEISEELIKKYGKRGKAERK